MKMITKLTLKGVLLLSMAISCVVGCGGSSGEDSSDAGNDISKWGSAIWGESKWNP